MKASQWIKFFFVISGGIIVVGVGWHYFQIHADASTNDIPAAAAEFPKTLAEYRRLGLPWTTADFAPPPPDDAKNAVTYLKAADDKLNSILPTPPNNPLPSGGPPQTTTSATTKIAETRDWKYKNIDFEPVLKFSRIASKQPKLDYHFQWDENNGRTSNLIADHKQITLLCYDAELAAKRSDATTAAADLTAAQNLAKLYQSGQDMLVSSLAARGTNRICHAYQTCLYDFFPNDGNFLRFTKEFHLEETKFDLKTQLQGAIYSFIVVARLSNPSPDSLRSKSSSYTPDDTDVVVKDGIPQSPRQQAYMDRIMEYWNKFYPKALKAKTLTEAGAILDEGDKQFADAHKDSYLALSAIGFDNGELLASMDEANSKIRAEMLLLRALQFKHTHKSWPTSISLLSPMKDPIKAQPYLMISNPNGIKIYSLVGRDTTTRAYMDELVHEHPDRINATLAQFPPPHLKSPEVPF